MPKLRSRLKSTMRTSLVVFTLLNTSGQLWAQTAQRTLQNCSVSDPFNGLHDALSSAADSLLEEMKSRLRELGACERQWSSAHRIGA